MLGKPGHDVSDRKRDQARDDPCRKPPGRPTECQSFPEQVGDDDPHGPLAQRCLCIGGFEPRVVEPNSNDGENQTKGAEDPDEDENPITKRIASIT